MIFTPHHPDFNDDEDHDHEQEQVRDHVVIEEDVRVEGSGNGVPASLRVIGGKDVALFTNEIGYRIAHDLVDVAILDVGIKERIDVTLDLSVVGVKWGVVEDHRTFAVYKIETVVLWYQ